MIASFQKKDTVHINLEKEIAPNEGIEPSTTRLRVVRSTNWANSALSCCCWQTPIPAQWTWRFVQREALWRILCENCFPFLKITKPFAFWMCTRTMVSQKPIMNQQCHSVRMLRRCLSFFGWLLFFHQRFPSWDVGPSWSIVLSVVESHFCVFLFSAPSWLRVESSTNLVL